MPTEEGYLSMELFSFVKESAQTYTENLKRNARFLERRKSKIMTERNLSRNGPGHTQEDRQKFEGSSPVYGVFLNPHVGSFCSFTNAYIHPSIHGDFQYTLKRASLV